MLQSEIDAAYEALENAVSGLKKVETDNKKDDDKKDNDNDLHNPTLHCWCLPPIRYSSISLLENG